MDPASCEKLLANGDVGTVVVTMGTTGLGVVDPLPAILELRKKYDFRIHADAAYGGYFGLTSEINADTKAALQAMSQVDTLVSERAIAGVHGARSLHSA